MLTKEELVSKGRKHCKWRIEKNLQLYVNDSSLIDRIADGFLDNYQSRLIGKVDMNSVLVRSFFYELKGKFAFESVSRLEKQIMIWFRDYKTSNSRKIKFPCSMILQGSGMGKSRLVKEVCNFL
jgi:hypothetical protein